MTHTETVSGGDTSAAAADYDSFEPRSEDVVQFPNGLPGFEQCRRFVVVASDDVQPFQILQGLKTSSPSFLTIDPTRVLPRYRMALGPRDWQRLGASADDPLVWLAIVTVADDNSATVNLRAPIVINPRLMVGFQVMPQDSLYPLRHPLSL